ncbi:hypothetical protein ABG067_000176 [Albugo candida]
MLFTRSPVYARHGMVATSQPLASDIGLSILKRGGNAVDAAIAVAAALGVLEPCSTGIGGDCFLLFFDAITNQVSGLNGSGRSPSGITLKSVQADLTQNDGNVPFRIPVEHGHSVTIPGTVAGWIDAVECWGTLPLREILSPSIKLAREGFPVGPVTSELWMSCESTLAARANGSDLLCDGKAPAPGSTCYNEYLAQVLEEIINNGKAGFYKGWVAKAITQSVREAGGALSMEDLASHKSDFVNPIKTEFADLDVYEVPPSGQGIAALLALNIMQRFRHENQWEVKHNSAGYLHVLTEALRLAFTDAQWYASLNIMQRFRHENQWEVKHNSAGYLHVLTEALRLAFTDAQWYACDPDHYASSNDATSCIPLEHLLSKEYASEHASKIRMESAIVDPKRGSPELYCDTVSFQVVDVWGNAVSMVNSVYEAFGSKIIPKDCGFVLQNRGSNFFLLPGKHPHPNMLGFNKRPYHTIIPAISVFAGSNALHGSWSCMGGFMQPQGHVQLLCNLCWFKMDPQEAIDAPRLCIHGYDQLRHVDDTSLQISLEHGIDESVVQAMRSLGHNVGPICNIKKQSVFGRAQMILKDPSNGLLVGGSDGRADGCAMGF